MPQPSRPTEDNTVVARGMDQPDTTERLYPSRRITAASSRAPR